jgi:uncharacterized cupredoxin-like copper-binding protein
MGLVGPDQVHDLVPAGGEQFGDQAPMATPPECLGAHEARRRLGQRAGERLLPLGPPHAGGVAPKGGRADAGEALLAGLAAATPAQLQRVPVGDSHLCERAYERLLVELRIALRAGKTPDVHERLGTGAPKRLHELAGRAGPVADRQHAHGQIQSLTMPVSCRRMRFTLAIALPLAAALLFAACGSGSEEAGGQSLAIGEMEYSLDPSTAQVDQAGTVTITVTNNGTIDHALEVEGQGVEEETDTIAPGESADLTVDLSKTGSYEIYCPIDGHREKGMEGTLTVGAAGAGAGTGTAEEEGTTTEGGTKTSGGGGYGGYG